MERFTFDATDEEGTRQLGAVLAELLPDGVTLALSGTLGAGKTRLVQAIAEACGISRRDVVSPTFVLAQEYHGRRTLYHFDAYRLRSEEEFAQLGPEEYFESDGLTLVEWADRVEGCLPPERVEVQIEVTGAESRRFEIRGLGPRYAEAVRQIRERLGR
jgi:tRNA threonylcarbamoyladenosine biosynthesis protein TsaE